MFFQVYYTPIPLPSTLLRHALSTPSAASDTQRIVKVFIPTPLRSYTGERAEVQAEGATLAEVLADLDRRHPGMRFRIIDEQEGIRRHMRIFINRDQARSLDAALKPGDEVLIFQALSGG